MNVYKEKLKNSIKQLELISEFSKIIPYKAKIQIQFYLPTNKKYLKYENLYHLQ